MLKIKDNVDLKELEKFGFSHIEEDEDQDEMYLVEDEDIKNGRCLIYAKDRVVRIDMPFGIWLTSETNVDVLYDLIKADLVVKIDD